MREAEIVTDTAVVVSIDRGKNDVCKVVLPRGHAIRQTWRIVDTDNFGGDYPNERFVAEGFLQEKDAHVFADAANKLMGEDASRHLMVVPHFEIVYTLAPGFEP